MYQYFIKVVPTVYKQISGQVTSIPQVFNFIKSVHTYKCLFLVLLFQIVKTNQFSVTKHKKVARAVAGESGLPGRYCIRTEKVRYHAELPI